MKKFELVAAISAETGYSQKDVTVVVDAFCKVVVDTCVTKGEEINLAPIGKFKQRITPARHGVNPLTGKKMDVPETHSIKFQPSASVRVRVGDKK